MSDKVQKAENSEVSNNQTVQKKPALKKNNKFVKAGVAIQTKQGALPPIESKQGKKPPIKSPQSNWSYQSPQSDKVYRSKITQDLESKEAVDGALGVVDLGDKVINHKVQAGEGLWTIARKYNPKAGIEEISQIINKIVELNQLGSINAVINPGQVLKIPSSSSSQSKEEKTKVTKTSSKYIEELRKIEQKKLENKPDNTTVYHPPLADIKWKKKKPSVKETTKTTVKKSAGGKTVSWLKAVKNGKISDKTLLGEIEKHRKNIPNYAGRLIPTDSGLGGHVYYGAKTQGMADPTPSTLKTSSSIKNKAQRVVWKELEKEGGISSINTYDDQIFTWGRGFSGKTFLKGILAEMLSTDAAIKQKFEEAGIGVDANNNILVVDTKSGEVKSGDNALYLIRANKTLMSFFIDMGENKKTKQASADAQWNVIKKNAGSIPDFVYDAKANKYKDQWSDNSVALSAHLEHWLPAGGWRVYRSAYKQTKGDSLNIIKAFCLLLGKNSYTQAIVTRNAVGGTYYFSSKYDLIGHISHFEQGTGFAKLKSKWKLVSSNIQTELSDKKNKGYLFIPYNGKHYSIKIE